MNGAAPPSEAALRSASLCRLPVARGSRVLLLHAGLHGQRAVQHPGRRTRCPPARPGGDGPRDLGPPLRGAHRPGGRHRQPAAVDRHRLPVPRRRVHPVGTGPGLPCHPRGAGPVGDRRDVPVRRDRGVDRGRAPGPRGGQDLPARIAAGLCGRGAGDRQQRVDRLAVRPRRAHGRGRDRVPGDRRDAPRVHAGGPLHAGTARRAEQRCERWRTRSPRGSERSALDQSC